MTASDRYEVIAAGALLVSLACALCYAATAAIPFVAGAAVCGVLAVVSAFKTQPNEQCAAEVPHVPERPYASGGEDDMYYV